MGGKQAPTEHVVAGAVDGNEATGWAISPKFSVQLNSVCAVRISWKPCA